MTCMLKLEYLNRNDIKLNIFAKDLYAENIHDMYDMY